MKFDKNHEIYNMSLHANTTIYRGPLTWCVTRVHDGWIYTTLNGNGTVTTSVFVPYKESEASND